MTLAATQRWMHDALIDPRAAPPDQIGLLAASGRLAAAGGLAIYQRGYFLRIAACMREQFPALCHALGAALFDDFVADYIHDMPPASHTLYDLGRRFPGWLAANRPDAEAPEAWIDFMVDLAGFERLVFTMFDAPGNEGKPFADAATPDDRLRLQPAFAVGAYRFPVAEFYHAVRQECPAPIPTAGDSHVALVRTDYVTHTIPLREPHHRFLRVMAEGGSVDDAIGVVAEALSVPPGEVRQSWAAEQGTRACWIDWGFFVRRDG